MAIKEIKGGVCAPYGFTAGGVHCGIRKNREKKDFALILSEVPCSAAGVFTQNLVKGAPVTLSQKHLVNGRAQAIICNSGNANTCNANGIEIAEGMCRIVEDLYGINTDDVLVASTGVIGQKLSLEPMTAAANSLKAAMGNNSYDAAEAIMTTDTKVKEVAISFRIGTSVCSMGAIAKGVGMVCPNMATNLIFITSDVNITPEMLKAALSEDVKTSFNMVSVDGDQSTNDTCFVLANGLAENELISGDGEAYRIFKKALNTCTVKLSKMIAKDGEGATKLVECKVFGATSVKSARNIAKTVIKSSLVKAAMFGADANWGRVLCAIGYSGEKVDVQAIDVSFSSKAGEICVCKGGYGVDFSEETAKEILSKDEIAININLNGGSCKAVAWGCDLTYDYVKINGDYRT